MENDTFVKSPAFQIYPADFLADKNTLVMSAAEVGGYWLLICVCWRENGLPDDLDELAGLARTPVKQFQESWEKRIKRCFIQRADGRWSHNRLEKERVKQKENRDKRKAAGKKGAEERWQTDSIAIAMLSNGDGKRIANDSLSSSSSSSIATSNEKKEMAHAVKPRSPRHSQTCNEEYLNELQAKDAYALLDVRLVHSKMVAWCEVKGKQPTRGRLLNWLNREDVPMGAVKRFDPGRNEHGNGHEELAPKPPPTITEEELRLLGVL